MKFLPVEKTLKDGRKIVIREAEKKDASALILCVSMYLMQSEHLISTIEEFNPTIQQEERWIKDLSERKNSILLIATYNNKIIGNLDLNGETRRKIHHNALLGIGIVKDWQNLGLGKLMLECIIDWAGKNVGLENIWLHVFDTNYIAIKLYESLGFKKTGVQHGYIKSKNGGIVSNIIMHLSVKNP